MINANFCTPVGEFITRFADKEEAYNKIGSDWIFNTPQGEPLMIPMDVQRNSVIILREVD